jgi:hypothetical protein
MNSRKIKVLVIVLLVSVLATACGSENTFNQQVAVAVVVGLTETAVALQQPSATPALQLASPEATIAAAGPVVSSSSYQPLSGDECNNLNVAFAKSLGSPGDIRDSAPFTDVTNHKSGMGCLMSFFLTSAAGANGMVSAVNSVLQNQGWTENKSYVAASPADVLDGYQKDNALCLIEFNSAPADPKLCPMDSNYYDCLRNLQPSQVMHIVIVNCARLTP